MRICIKCYHTTIGGRHCTQCGERTIPYTMECPHCKRQGTVTAKFCEECGRPMQEEAKRVIEERRKEVKKEDDERGVKEEMEKESYGMNG